MERDDRHKHENHDADMIARSMEAHQKDKQREHTRRMNKLWIWLGVMFLVAILLWWIFSIGFFEDTSGVTNFGN
ncbi:MAG: hypothetical protein J1D77_04330 [Muribaculaceae bacterium]|nr:hypothetical protein [Muribaculaceae bacterium]